MLSPGKALTDPLLVALAIAILCIAVALRRSRERRLLGIALLALATLFVFSTPMVAMWLERSLLVEPPDGAPEVIVIAGGGMAGTWLSDSSTSRVMTGAAWWKEHPRARLVIAGVDMRPTGPSPRTALLMRELAMQRGVPAERLELELQSANTREHASRLAALPGITPQTRVGIVTSGWHMRRALLAFRRHYPNVVGRAAELPEHEPLVINDWLPSSHALRVSTRMLHEWIGLAWYALRR
ncbi:MAG TPA: YdcF family protein [Thermoanaerobaculia bacterium]